MKRYLTPLLISSLVLGFFTFILWQKHIPAQERIAPMGGMINLFNGLDRAWYDVKIQAKPHEFAKRVIVAEIDDASLEKYGRWPWSREVFGKILTRLYQLGAETVAFDAVFDKPEVTPEWIKFSFESDLKKSSGNSEYESLKNKANLSEEQITVINRYLGVNGEQYFHEALVGTNTVLGYFWENSNCNLDIAQKYNSSKGGFRTNSEIDKLEKYLYFFRSLIDFSDSVTLKSMPVLNKDTKALFDLQVCPVPNRRRFSEATPLEGFFNARPDLDGVFRRSHLIVGFRPDELIEDLGRDDAEFLKEEWLNGATFFPSLSLRAVMAYLDNVDEIKEGSSETREGTGYSVELGKRKSGILYVDKLKILRKNGEKIPIEVSPDGSLPLNFFGSQFVNKPAVPKFSLASIFPENNKDVSAHYNKIFDEDMRARHDLDETYPLAGALVMVGPTSVGVYDLRPNPVDSFGAGVYLHATAAGRMLERVFDGNKQYYFRSLSFSEGIAVLWTVGLLIALIVAMTNGFSGLWIVFSLLGVALYSDYWFFMNETIVVETVTTLIGVSTVFAAILAYKYFTEGKDRAYLKGAFEKYVSPDLVDSIISDPKKLNLGGERKELSVLFSDVRGFTNISEKMTASELAQFMNDYLTPMTEIVIEERGTIDKYMGDAIMAIYGAPVPYEEHAIMAVRTGLRMLEKLDILRVEWEANGLPPIDIGVGVNTGDMSVGNMGSTRIFSYTVMGDSVNLGSRLEGLTKEYGVRFIVSASTKKHLKDGFILRELDRVRVKGKDEPVVIFEVLCEVGHESEGGMREKAIHFEEALKLYYEGKFDQAAAKFDVLKEADKTSVMYSERCALWLETPPEEGWDGSWTMTTK